MILKRGHMARLIKSGHMHFCCAIPQRPSDGLLLRARGRSRNAMSYRRILVTNGVRRQRFEFAI